MWNCLIIKFGSLFFGNMHKTFTSKDPQVGTGTIFSCPFLIWNLKVQWTWWRSIYQIAGSLSSFTPKCLRQACSLQHTPNPLNDGAIHHFSQTIMLWSARNNFLMLYTIPSAVSFKLPWGVLTSIIDLRHFSFLLVFLSTMTWNYRKYWMTWFFLSKKINPYLLGSIINKSDKVPH